VLRHWWLGERMASRLQIPAPLISSKVLLRNNRRMKTEEKLLIQVHLEKCPLKGRDVGSALAGLNYLHKKEQIGINYPYDMVDCTDGDHMQASSYTAYRKTIPTHRTDATPASSSDSGTSLWPFEDTVDRDLNTFIRLGIHWLSYLVLRPTRQKIGSFRTRSS